MTPFLVVGHRGAAARAPENTRASLKAALDAAAPAVEIDVALSADGRVVLLHDRTLDRTTSARGPVRRKRWDELRRLDAGSWFAARFAGEAMLDLDGALDLVRDRARLVVEIKDALAVDAVLAVLSRRGAERAVTISSFAWEALAVARRRHPGIDLAATVKRLERRDPVAFAVSIGASALHPNRALATPAWVERAHEAGLSVIPYTVNGAAELDRVLRAGANGCFTDDPGALLRLLARRGLAP
ncbi:MAG TPA: glycerophosphodiester phosphodiesterase family protein [Candidatus Polarisedimenticolaceae bacterium]